MEISTSNFIGRTHVPSNLHKNIIYELELGILTMKRNKLSSTIFNI